PQLPESVADATLVAWHKQPGDAIRRDENLADLETDKVVLEVPAPANGVVREIRVKSGTVVTSGQVLAVIDDGDTAATMPVKLSPAAMAQAAQAAATQATASGGGLGSKAAAAAAATAAPAPAPAPPAPAAARAAAAAEADAGRDGGKLSPSVRRLVEENRLDPAAIPASGRDGRLTKSDVVGFLDKKPAAAAAPAPAALPAAPAAAAAASKPGAAPAARAPAPAAPLPAAGSRAEQRVPMTRLRARIAQRLIEAQSTQALLTSFNEVDLTAVNELRARYKERFEKQHGVKLGFMSFFVKACIEALKKFPVVNASVDGGDIVYHEYYDIGVAVSTERGLVVPIVRDADAKSFGQIEKEVADYARKARDGTIALADLTGGTFTITNGGVFGSLMSTPIVNAPQSAILGMHKIQERPMVVDGEVAVRPMMYLAVTYDHRIIDGRDAVLFLVAVKDALEDPGRMLLGI
ncbi:MAG: 2-oxoglutarate dehydrogenase complex dihydrolipoyllysine-residue succinyltransferase, partial [Gammaproteobacteria bacterium]|nr:2-oxoglutarate dehydrogenase complex dihydrolipoyllysine-residue succinyltransferase [Gammaproteobacteria bacterium]